MNISVRDCSESAAYPPTRSMFGNYGMFKCSSIRREPAKLEERKKVVIAFGGVVAISKEIFRREDTSPALRGPAGKARV